MRKLTRASVRESAYDAYSETSPKIQCQAEYGDRATWLLHVACFIIHVWQGRLAIPQNRHVSIEARHSIFPRWGATCKARSAGE